MPAQRDPSNFGNNSHMVTGLGNGLNSFDPKHRDMPQEVYTKQTSWFAKTENQICAPLLAWKG